MERGSPFPTLAGALMASGERTSPAASPSQSDAPMNRDDAARARKGQIDQLVRDHHDFVWRTARRLGVRDSDIDDVVQEVFLMVTRHVTDIVRERAFLFRACQFAAARVKRTASRRREVDGDELLPHRVDASANPEESAEASQARRRLQTILDAMPDELRSVFVLFELERMTMAEIAEMTATPPGTVASRLRRAREQFLAAASRASTRGTP
ncbi:MAG: sigma-70 family RNA polymerase sigma factor [Labilithrix sp.]|nr:sigma-70 family RNA polymerase sigma factor [Labilithrix sp.]